MPHFSRFTPYGHLRFSSAKPIGESIFDSMVKSYGERGENISDDPDSDVQIRLYAQAMGIARWQLNTEHAGNQYLPFKADELLPTLEHDYGIVVPFGSTTFERQTVLARLMLKPLGAQDSALTASLSEALGADFISLFSAAEGTGLIQTRPTNSIIGEGGSNHQVKETTPIKLGQINESVTTAGGLTVTFQHVGGDIQGAMAPGSIIVISPGEQGIQEFLHLSTIGPVTVNADGSGTMALGTRPFPTTHGPGSYFTTGRYPFLVSTRRELIVILTPEAVRDRAKRDLVDEIMARNVRAVDLWAIVEERVTGIMGPFRIGVSPLGSTPLGGIGF